MLKDDLVTSPIVSVKDKDKPESPHCEVCDLLIGCLLLVIDRLLL